MVHGKDNTVQEKGLAAHIDSHVALTIRCAKPFSGLDVAATCSAENFASAGVVDQVFFEQFNVYCSHRDSFGGVGDQLCAAYWP